MVILLTMTVLGTVVSPVARAQDASPSPDPSATPQPLATPTPEPTATEPSGTVTLKASRSPVVHGQMVTLSGRVDPIVAGAEVQILDQDGNEVAATTPGQNGSYSVDVSLTRNVELRAYWLGTPSDPEPVKVRPLVKVSLQKVRLFGKAVVRGRVSPGAGGKLKLVIKRNGSTWRKWDLPAGGGFEKRIRITKPGSFKARAIYDPDRMKVGKSATTTRRAAIPADLTTGSKGGAVKRLEWRLRNLGYYIPGVNRSYGTETRDAVIAFNKIQHRVRSGSVEGGTWRALAAPRKPKARHSGSHIEIDQTQQVVMVVRKGKVKWVLHTSTGAGGASRDGTWTVHRKIAGYSPGRLYYPSYYDGLRAVHGWPDVPTYPASHGCARVPMWSATWIHSKMPMGTTVYVYH